MRNVKWICMFWVIGLLAMASPADVAAEDGEKEVAYKEAVVDLEKAAKSPVVEVELEEPDGVSIDMGDPNNWKIIAMGTGTYAFDDADERRDATQEATLEAKAALAKFMKERMSTSEQLDRLVEKKADKARPDGKVITSDASKTLKTTLTSIRNSADAMLTGLITLEATARWGGESGTVRVKLGQSQKTIDAAKRFRERTAASFKNSPSGNLGSKNGKAKSEPSTIRQKSKSDF